MCGLGTTVFIQHLFMQKMILKFYGSWYGESLEMTAPQSTRPSSCAGDLVVSDQLNDFCGVMAGLRVAASKTDLDTSRILNAPKGIQSTSFRSVMARLS